MKHIVNSDAALQTAIGDLRETYRVHKYATASIAAGKGRSKEQNSISHAWYGQVARELREDNEGGVKAFCKLHFGVPILRDADDDFRAKYDKAVRPMAYEDKLTLMEWFPVTSLMTTPQLSLYLEKVQAHYQSKGVWLEFPEEARRTA